MIEMHGQFLWAGWTAETKTLGHGFLGKYGVPQAV